MATGLALDCCDREAMGFVATTEEDVHGSARSIDCRSSGSQSARQFERVRPPTFERRQPANVLDEVLQADLDPRPHDADGAQQPAARRDLLGAEHMLDTRADAALRPVRCRTILYRMWLRQMT